MSGLVLAQNGYVRKPGPSARLRRDSTLSRKLIGAWLFNEGGGPAARNLVRGGNPVSLAGGAYYCPGLLGQSAIRTLGNGAYAQVDMPSDFTLLSSTVVIVAKCLGANSYATGGAPNSFQFLASVPAVISGLGCDYGVYVYSSNQAIGAIVRTQSVFGADISGPNTVTTWPTIVATTFGPTLRCWGGRKYAEIAYGGGATFNSPIRLGAGANGGGWDGAFNGIIESLFIFGRQLTSAEMAALVSNPYLFIEDPLTRRRSRAFTASTPPPAGDLTFRPFWDRGVIVRGGGMGLG